MQMFQLKVKKKYPIYVVVLLFLVMGAAECYKAFFPPMFYINTTLSEPQGIYKIVSSDPALDLKKGDFIIVDVPENMQSIIYGRGWAVPGTPLLKQIGGLAGDEYTVTDTEFLINNTSIGPIAKIDQQGEPLPQLEKGTKKVSPGHLLAISSHHNRSFDSRYMGEIEMSSVKAKVVPIVTFN
jgi:conjugative transfer signal peptidase TraF